MKKFEIHSSLTGPHHQLRFSSFHVHISRGIPQENELLRETFNLCWT